MEKVYVETVPTLETLDSSLLGSSHGVLFSKSKDGSNVLCLFFVDSSIDFINNLKNYAGMRLVDLVSEDLYLSDKYSELQAFKSSVAAVVPATQVV